MVLFPLLVSTLWQREEQGINVHPFMEVMVSPQFKSQTPHLLVAKLLLVHQLHWVKMVEERQIEHWSKTMDMEHQYSSPACVDK